MGFWRGKKRYATKEIFQRQVELYDTIKPIQTYRGIFVMIFLVLLVLGFLGVLIESDSSLEPMVYFLTILIALIVYAPVLYFTYHGKRWAIVLMMALIILNQVFIFIDGAGVAGIIISFALLSLLYEALKVENARRKLKSPSHPKSGLV